jgi:hypothetical protein
MKTLSKILILIVCFLSAVFAFGLVGGIIGGVFAIAAIILEAVKFTSVTHFETGDESKRFILGGIIAAITSFSIYASHNAIDTALAYKNTELVQSQMMYNHKLEQYKSDLALYKADVQYQSDLSTQITNTQNSIQEQLQRSDRNKITDERIKEDRKALKDLRSEIKTPVAPVEPVKPNLSEIPREVSWFFALLIEASALVTCFYSRRKLNHSKTEPVVETVKPKEVKEPKRSNEKAKPETNKQPKFNTVKEALNLTEAQRVKLHRRLKAKGLDWKTFNSDIKNVKAAKEMLK